MTTTSIAQSLKGICGPGLLDAVQANWNDLFSQSNGVIQGTSAASKLPICWHTYIEGFVNLSRRVRGVQIELLGQFFANSARSKIGSGCRKQARGPYRPPAVNAPTSGSSWFYFSASLHSHAGNVSLVIRQHRSPTDSILPRGRVKWRTGR